MNALLAELGTPERRPHAVVGLAQAWRAAAVLVLVPDPRTAELVPAPGFVQPVEQGAGWRALLASCARPGTHRGEVAHPGPGKTAAAVAEAFEALVVVLVGVGDAEIGARAALAPVAPLLARMLGAELELSQVRAELAAARSEAARVAELAAALDEARGQAEAAARVKDEFLALLGHELRNPLAPIVTALHLIRKRDAGSREHDIIVRQVTHLMRLVDDLLDVSRITRGRIELRKERFEASLAIVRALEMARPLLDQRRQVVEVQAADVDLLIEADLARMGQVISNLLTNAAKYSDEGSTITVSADRVDERVRITVSDRGIGIAGPLLAHIFDPFVQTPQGIDRARGGLGLGLSLVRSLVQMHGGEVQARSDGPGKGSQFIVEVPAAEVRPTLPPQTFSTVTVRPAGAKKRVLIVDDNIDAAELLDFALGESGCVTQCAHDGKGALAALVTFEPDVALLDIGLPDVDGYELARRVRALRPDVVLIALTGYGQESDRAKARAAGFDAHLVKPVGIDDVRAAIEHATSAR